MKRTNILFITILLSLTLFAFGCSSSVPSTEVPADTNSKVEETVETPVATPETEVEETIKEVEESTEELVEETEEDTSNLSNEEWVKSLNLQTLTLLIFNDVTGERKVLEDGEEYTLVEGDEFGYYVPTRWSWQGDTGIYNNMETKYDCFIFELNYDLIDTNTEFTIKYNNRDGELITATVYLSK